LYGIDHLEADLARLGVGAGDTLFTHSSFRSLGPVEGGAATVVAAMAAAVAPGGLLLMPSFNLVERKQRAQVWDVTSTPSTVGWLTEFFRRMPGTCRSDHYSHSVAARGPDARAFVADHRSLEGDESPWDEPPWGRTYGTHSPMFRAYRQNAQLLMLGVDYDSSTYCHLVEVLYWHHLRAGDPEAGYPALDRAVLGSFWDRVGSESGAICRGPVGAAPCRLFRVAAYVDCLLVEVKRNPEPYTRSVGR